MNRIQLPLLAFSSEKKITLPGSKSISNRLLILQFLSGAQFEISNLSLADDTRLLKELLWEIKENQKQVLDCKNAGTVFRFLVSALSITPGTWTLTGSSRMQERPVADLVNALRQLGADIRYLQKEGFPPLEINGKILQGGNVELKANLSSQYVSSLMLIGPFLSQGLQIHLQGTVSSEPYIVMTQRIIHFCGIPVSWQGTTIQVHPAVLQPIQIRVENDWSAASYFYGIAALGNRICFSLEGLMKESLQGDGLVLPALFEKLGVETIFTSTGITIKKSENLPCSVFEYDFTHEPDLAQTFAVCCAGLGIPATLKGLHSLKIKETDRLQALKTELVKMNVSLSSTENTLHIEPSKIVVTEPVKTYGDHRMAMAFAMLSAKYEHVEIESPQVVEKSFPDFWKEISPDF